MVFIFLYFYLSIWRPYIDSVQRLIKSWSNSPCFRRFVSSNLDFCYTSGKTLLVFPNSWVSDTQPSATLTFFMLMHLFCYVGKTPASLIVSHVITVCALTISVNPHFLLLPLRKSHKMFPLFEPGPRSALLEEVVKKGPGMYLPEYQSLLSH